MRVSKKLSAAEVANLSKPGAYADGGGLYLQIGPTGTKSWLFRYMIDRKAKKMGLGPFPAVSLADARKKAMECQRQRYVDEVDPLAEKRRRIALRAEADAKAMSFEDAADAYIKAHRAGWKNLKHAGQWAATLKTYVYPTIGKLPVASIDVGLILKVLEPVWTEKPETASRVRGRVESILDWATARGYRTGENPARWRGHLDKLLPARSKVAKVKHHSALPYADMGAFMADLRGRDGTSARALEFAILTATRTGETVGARWSEIDMVAKQWTIPADRMKAGKEHRLPLSDRVIEILKALPREEGSDLVFIGDKKGQALSNMALLMTLRRMERSDLTTHGFRSTFRDWGAEQTAYPNEMLEMALAHVVSDKTEAAYRRGDMMERRRRLMADWAAFCAKKPAKADNVTPLRADA